MSDDAKRNRKALGRGITDAIDSPEASATTSLLKKMKPRSLSLELSQPSPAQPNPAQPSPIAPARDYNKRANSLDRTALPAGLFPGTSKKLYDALYLRTRGAVTPARTIQATKREMMLWSGIRSKNTIAVNLQLLTSSGLIARQLEVGSQEGSIYEVRLPEELDPTQPNPTYPNPTQHLGLDPTQQSGWDGSGKAAENKAASESAKTSFKTKEEKLDDDAALALLHDKLQAASMELTGKPLSAAEQTRWGELADVLIAELKIATARTIVSSVPAFLTEHLRRRLWKIDKKQAHAEGRELPDEVSTITTAPPGLDAAACPDCGGSGWWYPQGESKGVAKCKHESLRQPSGGQTPTPGAT